MKFTVTFKDPDVLQDAAKEAAASMVADIEGLDEDEREGVIEQRTDTLLTFAGEWVDYGEYVTIEFDTEVKTATVLRSKQ